MGFSVLNFSMPIGLSWWFENSAPLELLAAAASFSSPSWGAGDDALESAGALGDLRGMEFRSRATNITEPNCQ